MRAIRRIKCASQSMPVAVKRHRGERRALVLISPTQPLALREPENDGKPPYRDSTNAVVPMTISIISAPIRG